MFADLWPAIKRVLQRAETLNFRHAVLSRCALLFGRYWRVPFAMPAEARKENRATAERRLALALKWQPLADAQS